MQSCLGPLGLHLAATKWDRHDAIERRSLMQPDEGIRIQPMPAGGMPLIDQYDADIGVVDERVDERHTRCPRADNQVVRVKHPRHVRSRVNRPSFPYTIVY